MASWTRVLVCVAILPCLTGRSLAMENATAVTSETSTTHQLGDFPSDDSTVSLIRNAVVATVIGVGCVATLCLFLVFGVLHCYISKDKVRDLDGMEYEYQDEYEVRINFDVLDKLDPEIRDKIDLDFLAHLTNTDPALLEKYKVHPSSEGETPTHSVCSSHTLHSSQSSLKDLAPPKRRSLSMKLHSVKPSSAHNSPTLKRVSTFTDIKDLLNMSLNNTRQTGSTRKSHDMSLSRPNDGSHTTVDEGQKYENMTRRLLRLLTAVELAEENSEHEMTTMSNT